MILTERHELLHIETSLRVGDDECSARPQHSDGLAKRGAGSRMSKKVSNAVTPSKLPSFRWGRHSAVSSMTVRFFSEAPSSLLKALRAWPG